MKKLILIPALFLALFLGGCSTKLFGGNDFLMLNSFTTMSRLVTTTGTPLEVLPINIGRTYALITNDSATTTYLSFSSAHASSTFSVRLAANGGTYTIDSDNLYSGPIYATTTEAGLEILVTEK